MWFLKHNALKFLHISIAVQVYRIDHYLGKEMAQNLLIMRFYNSFIAPCWNREYISNIQICFKVCQ